MAKLVIEVKGTENLEKDNIIVFDGTNWCVKRKEDYLGDRDKKIQELEQTITNCDKTINEVDGKVIRLAQIIREFKGDI